MIDITFNKVKSIKLLEKPRKTSEHYWIQLLIVENNIEHQVNLFSESDQIPLEIQQEVTK